MMMNTGDRARAQGENRCSLTFVEMSSLLERALIHGLLISALEFLVVVIMMFVRSIVNIFFDR